MLNQRTQYGGWQVGSYSDFDVREFASYRLYPLAKRGLDLLVATIALILLAPFMAAIAIAIKLDSDGPVLHIQRRAGLCGRVFYFYKFRSMTNGHDHTQEHRKFAQAYINGRPAGVSIDNNGNAIFKPASNGHTITRVGKWLRSTSLDELPQLINVLKGDMSLVGPRPAMDYEMQLFSERHRQRLAVLPGLTGWAQVHGRSKLCFDEIVTLDIEYIRQRSLKLDVQILLATVPVVLSTEHSG